MAYREFTWTSGDGAAPANYPQSYWQEMFRTLFQAADPEACVIRGCLNEFEVTATGTPRQVQIDTGGCIVNGAWMVSDAVVNITAPTLASNTVHRIVLEYNDTLNSVRPNIVENASSITSLPDFDRTGPIWQAPLASISVSAGGSVTVTNERKWLQVGGFQDVNNIRGPLTLSAYNALTTKDPTTIYLIE